MRSCPREPLVVPKGKVMSPVALLPPEPEDISTAPVAPVAPEPAVPLPRVSAPEPVAPELALLVPVRIFIPRVAPATLGVCKVPMPELLKIKLSAFNCFEASHIAILVAVGVEDNEVTPVPPLAWGKATPL